MAEEYRQRTQEHLVVVVVEEEVEEEEQPLLHRHRRESLASLIPGLGVMVL